MRIHILMSWLKYGITVMGVLSLHFIALSAAKEGTEAWETIHTLLEQTDRWIAGEPLEITPSTYDWAELSDFHNYLIKAMAMDPILLSESPVINHAISAALKYNEHLDLKFKALFENTFIHKPNIHESWQQYMHLIEEILFLRKALRFRHARKHFQDKKVDSVYHDLAQTVKKNAPKGTKTSYVLPAEVGHALKNYLAHLKDSFQKSSYPLIKSASVDARTPAAVSFFLDYNASQIQNFFMLATALFFLCLLVGYLVGYLTYKKQRKAWIIHESFSYQRWLKGFQETLEHYQATTQTYPHHLDQLEQSHKSLCKMFTGLCLNLAKIPSPWLHPLLEELHRQLNTQDLFVKNAQQKVYRTSDCYKSLLHQTLSLCDAMENILAAHPNKVKEFQKLRKMI